MGLFLKTFFLLLFGFYSFSVFAAGHIHVKDAWIRAAPPTARVVAAYMTISNTGEKECKLTGISSSAFARIEIHRSVVEKDMARMEPQRALLISPHETVALQPGGLHLMLMEARKPLQSGDSLILTLSFHNGEEISVTATVSSGQAGEMDTIEHSRYRD